MWDSHSNFAKGTLTNSPGTAGTSFVLSSGEGALFSADMPITISPDNVSPTDANSEIGYVTGVSTDTLTVTRTQQGSNNQDVQSGWIVRGSITTKALTDIETAVDGKSATGHTHTTSQVTDFDTGVSNNTDVAANTTARHTHSNQAVLDATTASFTAADETKLDGIESGAQVNTVTATNTVTLTNKTTTNPVFNDATDTTKKVSLDISTISTGTTRSIAFPNAHDTLAGVSAAQTLTNKTLTTPTIASFTNATHDHSNAAGGGTLTIGTATTGTLGVSRGGTGATTFTGILKGNGALPVSTVTAPTGDLVGTTDSQTLTNKTLTQSAWTAVTFQNSWVNFGGTAQTCAYMKDSMGFVHLKGLAKSGTMSAVVFNLPAGYRPALIARFPTVSNGVFGCMDIEPDGDVISSVGSNVWFSFDGITFKAEN